MNYCLKHLAKTAGRLTDLANFDLEIFVEVEEKFFFCVI